MLMVAMQNGAPLGRPYQLRNASFRALHEEASAQARRGADEVWGVYPGSVYLRALSPRELVEFVRRNGVRFI